MSNDGGTLRIAPQYRQLLERARLDDFDALLRTTSGHLMRRLSDRENWRLDLPEDGGAVRRAYLKKHRSRSIATWMRRRFGIGPGRTAGRVEADFIERLHHDGVPTMNLIAFGERLATDGTLESLLLTEELAGYEQLDKFLDLRFAARTHESVPDLHRLIDRVAEVAGKFHQLGYNHRDFYTCHFFIREPAPGEFQVCLIDLQRVQRRSRLRRRWIVKDLAQLAYSAPADLIGPVQRALFLKRYLEIANLDFDEGRLARSVLRKERWMNFRLGPYR